MQDYHDRPQWVAAVAESVRDFQARHGRADKLMFSMHGIPQRYVKAGDPYEAQCRVSVGLIALYYILLAGGNSLAHQGLLSPIIGVWAPDGVLLAAAFVLNFSVARSH